MQSADLHKVSRATMTLIWPFMSENKYLIQMVGSMTASVYGRDGRVGVGWGGGIVLTFQSILCLSLKSENQIIHMGLFQPFPGFRLFSGFLLNPLLMSLVLRICKVLRGVYTYVAKK